MYILLYFIYLYVVIWLKSFLFEMSNYFVIC